MWQSLVSCLPVQYLVHCFTNWDILDLIFFCWCILGFCISLLVHIGYQLLYPKGTESRDLWSPVLSPSSPVTPEASIPRWLHSEESCNWLNRLIDWFRLNQNYCLGQSWYSLEEQFLQTLNDAASDLTITFLEFSFGNSPPRLISATSQLSSDGSHVLLFLKIRATELRSKLQLRHSTAVYDVFMIDFSSDAVSQLQLASSRGGRQANATLRLVGKPSVRASLVREAQGQPERPGTAGERDWVANQVLLAIRSAVARFPLLDSTCLSPGLQMPSLRQADADCQTEDRVSAAAADAASGPWPDAVHADPRSDDVTKISCSSDFAPLSVNQNTLPSLSNEAADSVDSAPRTTKTSKQQLTMPGNQNPASTTDSREGTNELPTRNQNLLVKVIRASGVTAGSHVIPHPVTVVSLEIDEPLQYQQTGPAYGNTNPYWDQHFVL